jgi:hypothetical protein
VRRWFVKLKGWFVNDPEREEAEQMSVDLHPHIQEWLAARDLYLADVRERFGIGDSALDADSNYGQLDGLTELYEPAAHPGRFHFADGRQVLLYIGSTADELADLKPDQVMGSLGGPGLELASRAGKSHTQHVYPEKGLAFSEGDDQVDFVEVFPPTSADAYLSDLYIDPGPFNR